MFPFLKLHTIFYFFCLTLIDHNLHGVDWKAAVSHCESPSRDKVKSLKLLYLGLLTISNALLVSNHCGLKQKSVSALVLFKSLAK